MKVGIVGLGVVGNALREGLQKIGQEVSFHDVKLQTTIHDILATDVVFVCVPTNSTADNRCDTSIVESVVEELINNCYNGIIAIKSTVEPGFTQRQIEKYNNQNICFVPEFLRQWCAAEDFYSNHDVLVVGTTSDAVFEMIKKTHQTIPNHVEQVSPTEAEIVKYFNNVHNAMEIVFANATNEVTEKLGANYRNVFNAITKRKNINPSYLRCSEEYKGYTGACLPKDTTAWASISKELGVDVMIFDAIVQDNKRYL